MDVRSAQVWFIACALLVGSACGEDDSTGQARLLPRGPGTSTPPATGTSAMPATEAMTPMAPNVATDAAGDPAGAAGTASGVAGMGGAAPVSTDDGQATMPEASWLAIYDDIFVRAGCNGPGLCHGGAAGMLPMRSAEETYAALVGVAAGSEMPGTATMACKDSGLMRVVPGAPEQSLLMMKLDGTQTCGDPMPPGVLLTEDERAKVRAWIMQGAPDN